MISKGPHLRDQPAEQRTSLTNELLNISPSLSCLLLLLFILFLQCFFLCFHSVFLTMIVLFGCFGFALSSCLHKILPKYIFLLISLFFYLFISVLSPVFFICLVFFHLLFDVCFLGPLKQRGLIFFFFSFLHRQSTAAFYSSKFIGLHIRHRAASYTHMLILPIVETCVLHQTVSNHVRAHDVGTA